MNYAKFMFRTVSKTLLFCTFWGLVISPSAVAVTGTLAVMAFITHMLGKESK